MVVSVGQGVLQLCIEMVPGQGPAQNSLGVNHQPGKLDVVSVGKPRARRCGNRLPIQLPVKRGPGGLDRVEPGSVDFEGFLQRFAHLGIVRCLEQFSQRLHQVQVGIGAFGAAQFHDDRCVRVENGFPITLEMLDPPSVGAIMGAELEQAVKLQGLVQRGPLTAGPVVFHHPVNRERFTIHNLPLVQRFARQIGGPVIAAVFLVEEVVLQKMITLSGRLQIVAPRIRKAVQVRMRETPNHACLSDQLLFGGRGSLTRPGIRKHIPAVLAIHRGVVPIRQNVLDQLRLHRLCIFGGGVGLAGQGAQDAQEPNAVSQRPKPQDQRTIERRRANVRHAAAFVTETTASGKSHSPGRPSGRGRNYAARAKSQDHTVFQVRDAYRAVKRLSVKGESAGALRPVWVVHAVS